MLLRIAILACGLDNPPSVSSDPFAGAFESVSGKPGRGIVLLLAGVLTLLASARIAATYQVFSQTWDEPAHIAAGMEWLDRGRYTFEPLHPPLARAMTALGPYIMGERLSTESDFWREGNRILGSGRHYTRTLSMARAGNLPFFLVACVCVFLLGLQVEGTWLGLCSLLLFTTLPPILAHAALATTDMGATAGVVAAVTAFLAFSRTPSPLRGSVLGVAIGAAIACKLSNLLFLPAVLGTAWLLMRTRQLKQSDRPPSGLFPASHRGRPVIWAALVTLWAAYRFSIGPILPADASDACVQHTQSCRLSRAAVRTFQASIYPAPEFFNGLTMLTREVRTGRKGYLLGERSRNGWWLFFPIAIALKTPLPFLVLTGLGAASLLGHRGRRDPLLSAVPFLSAIALLLVCLPSRITIGLRHALPVYSLLSVVAAQGVTGLWRWRRASIGRAVACLLLSWQGVESLRAHPDYLAYFNELAIAEPEHYLVDSDLDWGQDLKRLASFTQSRRIGHLYLAYHGTADPQAVGLTDYTPLAPYERPHGWVAVSVYALKLGSPLRPTIDDYAWLETLEPRARVGRSILVYWVTDSTRTTGR